MLRKNKLFRSISGAALALVFIAAFICCVPNKTYAASETKFLTSLDSTQDTSIAVLYDTEKPKKIAFIAPGGKRYEKKEDFDQIAEGENAVYYYISDAPSGSWQIEYDKGSNKELTVSVMPWHKPVTIDSFTFSANKKPGSPLPYIEGKLNVSYAKNYYNYKIYALTSDSSGQITNKYEIGNGSGRAGGDCEFSIYPGILQDNEYQLMAEVYAEDSNGTEVSDTAVASGKFTITGNTAAGDMSLLKLECGLTDSELYITFDTTDKDVHCDEYALIVSQEKAADYLDIEMTEETTPFNTCVLFNPDDGDITVQINGSKHDGGYITWKKTFTPTMPVTMSIDTDEKTNAANAVINFDAGSNTYNGAIVLNGSAKQVIFNGSNTVQVELEPETSNELEVWVINDIVYYYINKRISVDTIPPFIDIFGASDNMTTEEKEVVFIGKTEADVTFTCNGETVTLADDGSFTLTKDVNEGANEFRFEALDTAGNSSVRVINISKSGIMASLSDDGKDSSGFMKFFISLAAAAVLALILFIIGMTAERRSINKGLKPKPYNTILVSFITIISASFIGTGVYQLILNGKRNKELSGESLINIIKSNETSDIALMIKEKYSYIYNALISFGAALLLIILLIVYFVIRRIIKNKKKPAP